MKLPEKQVSSIVNAVVDSSGGAILELEKSPATQPIAEEAKIAFSDATRYGAYCAAGFLTLGFLSTLSLGGKRREESAK